MESKEIFIGNQKLKSNTDPVKGEYIKLDGETYYKISNYDKMTPFFMTIVSNSDHWMFISSNGGLTAGRKNPDNAIFPYANDDVIHSVHEYTGSKTIIHAELNDAIFIWEPLSDNYNNVYNIKRNLYKNIPGNKIIFEEENTDLRLCFSYSWMNSEKYGFVRKSNIVNQNKEDVKINILDGIQNILPYGVYQQFQLEFSTLADGYKKNELLSEYGIGIYSLSSIPSDKAEPSESLKASIVWSTGVEVEKYLLSPRQVDQYKECLEIESEKDVKAAKGSYLINTSLVLTPESNKNWYIIADLNYDSPELVKLTSKIKSSNNLIDEIIEDVNDGTKKLISLVASSDGLQLTNDKLTTSRHFSNVLFNIMRGGIFNDSYNIDVNDFILFMEDTNKVVSNNHKHFISNIGNQISYNQFIDTIRELGDSELTKLAMEYLPLTFSRRHGDPSRPWNRFSIDIKNSKNEKILNYQGNWRDIFQNWEALALSFPTYLDSMIIKFLNTTTADGYNPYRVTREGFDWEIPDPEMPWANIGYWGDHQIIYLLKLLELSSKYNPESLKSLVSDEIFSYANVPYRIKSYQELLKNSKDTIDFDHELNEKILSDEKQNGSDARFITRNDGTILQVNLVEKLLIPLMSKLSNFIPEGGIWMNTQRPEWNDANNALVGNGVSMVTLYYIKRYIQYCIDFFDQIDISSIELSDEVKILLSEIFEVFNRNCDLLKNKISDEDRKLVLDGLGKAGSKFRQVIYSYRFSSQKSKISIQEIIEFLKVSKEFIDHTIKMNKRNDGLYHSYNLMTVYNDKIEISHLYEMLEGQVAVLSSGYLSNEDAVKLLKSLRDSSLYREDQNSYILYPDRRLPLFIEKNIIPDEISKSSGIIQKLVSNGNEEIVKKDINGIVHFNGEISNGNILTNRLKDFRNRKVVKIDEDEIQSLVNIYESIFNHKAFTGRSGTFYKYEGLGSIYWHMVSKLVLAVQEVYYNVKFDNSSPSTIKELKNYYYVIRDGIGVTKSPDAYGAFPTDPYSHTPCFSGVQQPGLTGQVKEDIISRFGELGVIVEDGKISIDLALLNIDEFLLSADEFTYFDVNGKEQKLVLEKNSLAFTYCQVPIIYTISSENKIVVNMGATITEFDKLQIDDETSKSIFNREGVVKSIIVKLKQN